MDKASNYNAPWENLTEDNGVRKKTIVEGTGEKPKPGDKVGLMFCCTLADGTVVSDTFADKKPLRLTAGMDASIPGIEKTILSMRYGEKVQLEIEPKYGFGNFDNHHGFHGSGVRIPPNSKLFFELHLLEGDLAVAKSFIEWVESAELYKNEGNTAFTSGDNEKANQQYEKALKLLENLSKQSTEPPASVLEGKSEDQKNKINEEYSQTKNKILPLQVACLSNMSQVFLKKKEFSNAKEFARKALALDPNNSKSFFRLAKGHRGLEEYEQSLKELQKALAITPTKELQKEIAEVKVLLQEQINQQKKAFAGMFNKNSSNSLGGLYEDAKPEPPPRWKCNICGEEMDAVQQARHIIKKHGDKKQ